MGRRADRSRRCRWPGAEAASSAAAGSRKPRTPPRARSGRAAATGLATTGTGPKRSRAARRPVRRSRSGAGPGGARPPRARRRARPPSIPSAGRPTTSRRSRRRPSTPPPTAGESEESRESEPFSVSTPIRIRRLHPFVDRIPVDLLGASERLGRIVEQVGLGVAETEVEVRRRRGRLRGASRRGRTGWRGRSPPCGKSRSPGRAAPPSCRARTRGHAA